MSIRIFRSMAMTALLALAVISCKDDDETTVLPSLTGSLSFKVPAYIEPEAVLTVTPSGITHPDGEGVGYYWKVTPTMTQYDTTRYENGLDFGGNPSDGSFTTKISDTLQVYTVTGYAYADGYSATSRSYDCTAVLGGVTDGSITNSGVTADSPSVTVNGIVYYYTTIGDKDWMSRNLSDDTSGAPYSNCTAMNDVFGRYYSYEEALTVCPEGWELPTEADWMAMAQELGGTAEEEYGTIKGIAAKVMGNAYFNDQLMWEYWPAVGAITNESGLAMIPAGYSMLGVAEDDAQESIFYDNRYPQAIFKGRNEYAVFWTADKVADEEGMAYYRYLICDQPDLMISKGDVRSFGASVRCVRSTAE